MPKRSSLRVPVVFAGAVALGPLLAGACSPSAIGAAGAGGSATSGTGGGAASTSTATTTSGAGGTGTAGGGGSGSGLFVDGGIEGGLPCPLACSSDLHSVIDCNGNVVQACTGTSGCDLATLSCANACQVAVATKQSVGCEYYATNMDQFDANACFAAFVANTWDTPVHIAVDFAGTTLPVATFARIPTGAGPALTYAPYDATAGLAPGEVAILFLGGYPPGAGGDAGPPSDVLCPAPTAMQTGSQISNASGIGASFHITTDVPVVATRSTLTAAGSPGHGRVAPPPHQRLGPQLRGRHRDARRTSRPRR